MSELQLYSYYRSSTSYRVRIALHYKKLNFEYMPVHLLNNGGEQNQESYRKLNAMGGVPCLIHNGHAIGQSHAIIEYLDAIYPEPALIPKEPLLRARARQICDNINCEIHPLSNLRVTQYMERNLHIDESKRMQWIHHWNCLGLTATEKLVRETAGTYAIGAQVSIADIFIVAHLFTANRFGVPLHDYPELVRINENCLKLEGFQKAHPSKQPDTPKE